jgi:hypothetical protein
MPPGLLSGVVPDGKIRNGFIFVVRHDILSELAVHHVVPYGKKVLFRVNSPLS